MAVAEAPFDLVDVKLAPPVLRPGTVAKADVVERLCAQQAPLLTLVAPAGYGKTTLLANWAEADARPFAWVALDGRDDDDAVMFLRYIASAIHGVEPVSPEVLSALAGPGGSVLSKRIPQLGRALSAIETPLVLVLDDLHRISSPACLDALTALFQYVPMGSLIVVSSREEPQLPLGRWRAQGLVHELGVEDLRLEEPEAEVLLGSAGVALDESEISDLTARTEGWPAGLYLAALSLQAGAAPRAANAGSFTGDNRFVSEYFRLELMSRLPTSEAQFLKYTSVLDRMSGGLCDAVLQTTGSARTLDRLESTNRFVVPLDGRRRWFRYHHLFGELLRDELERSEPDAVRALNARAMDWCLANDEREAAILYARAAGEADTAAALIDELALSVYYDGRIDTIDDWLTWFGDDELMRYPALAIVGAWVRVLTGRHAEAERWLALADGAESAIPLSDGSATIKPWVAALRTYMMPDGVERALEDADLALDDLSARSIWRPVVLVIRGVAHALLGSTDRATDDLKAALKAGLAHGNTDIVFIAHAELALLAAQKGSWEAAAQNAREAQSCVDDAGVGDSYASSAIVHVTAARIALHEARYDDARAALARAHRLRPLLDEGSPWLAIQVGLELTRAHLALAEAGAARTVLTETELMLELRPRMGVLVHDARDLHEQVAASTGPSGAWAMSLTRAELRLLPYLATYLSFPEVAGRLFVSRNTVKTEAVSIYRKLGVSSRSDAIERAVELGLLDRSVSPPKPDFTQEG